MNIKSGNNSGQLRVLLDSASEINFIMIAACNRLNIKLDNICESISGLNNMSCAIDYGCRILLKSRTSKFELAVYCLAVLKITKNLPLFVIKTSKLSIP